MSTYLALN